MTARRALREWRRAGGAAAAALREERRCEAHRLLQQAWAEREEAAVHEVLHDWHVEVPNSFWPRRRGQRAASRAGCMRARLQRLCTVDGRRRLEMEVQGPGEDEWRHHDAITLSVPQVLGRAPCGDDGTRRCRLVPAAAVDLSGSSDSEEEALAQEEQRAAAAAARQRRAAERRLAEVAAQAGTEEGAEAAGGATVRVRRVAPAKMLANTRMGPAAMSVLRVP